MLILVFSAVSFGFWGRRWVWRFSVLGGFPCLVVFLSLSFAVCFYLGFYVADLSVLLFDVLVVLGDLLWFVVWIETRVWLSLDVISDNFGV